MPRDRLDRNFEQWYAEQKAKEAEDSIKNSEASPFTDEDDEPKRTSGAKARQIVSSFVGCAACYFPARMMLGEEATEDVMDLAHSLYSAGTAVWNTAQARPAGKRLMVLPKEAAWNMEKMFCNSLGYFLADAVLVLGELSRGHKPHLWEGRLLHHVIQSVANSPAVFCTGSQGARGIRTYLGLAYVAEASSIFLRLHNILKRNAFPWVTAGMQRGIFVGLLVSFGLSRVVNFVFCTFLIWRHHGMIPSKVWKFHLGFAGLGYAMNLVWFTKLLSMFNKEAVAGAAAGAVS